jgi:hypothetical protein
MSEWIKCSERLPGIEDHVLCRWADGHHESAMLEEVDGKLWHCLDDGEILIENPTHWQPLPPPPAE